MVIPEIKEVEEERSVVSSDHFKYDENIEKRSHSEDSAKFNGCDDKK